MTDLTLHGPKKDAMGIPVAPGHLPLLGHAWVLHNDLFGLVRRMKATGEPLLWVEPTPGTWVVDCVSAEGLEFLRAKNTSNHHYTDLAGLVLGHSLLTRDGAEHRDQRNAMNPPFTPKGLDAQGTAAVMAETVKEHVEKMLDAGEFVALTATRELALDIIFRVLGIGREALAQWRGKYEEVLLGLLPLKWNLPGLPAWRARRARAWVDAHLKELIAEHRARPGQPGLLAEMVRAWDEGGQDDDQKLIDNVLLLALAGHETTAATMAWMFCIMARDASFTERLVDEAAGADLPTRPPELARFPLTEALFRECLRYYPPVAAVSRLLTEPLEVFGRTLPAGVQLSFPIVLWQRDSSRYEDADTFKPERWLGRDRRPQPIDNVAFSYGPHFCLGYHVAWMEAVQAGVAMARGLGDRGQRLALTRGFPEPTTLGTLQPTKRHTRLRLRPA